MPDKESEATTRTKARFEEVFRSYTTFSDGKNTSNTKKKNQGEHIVLETFKNQLDLSKESENETIINNTYNAEEESPRYRKNKLREKIPATEKQSNVIAEDYVPTKTKTKKTTVAEIQFESEHDQYKNISGKKIPKGGKKKGKSVVIEEEDPTDPTDFDDNDQLIEAYRLQFSQEETNEIKEKIKKKLKARISEISTNTENQPVSLNNEIGVKKKKKKKELTTSVAETSSMFVSEAENQPAYLTIQSQEHMSALDASKESQNYLGQDEEFTKAKRKKLKKIEKSVTDNELGTGIEDHIEDRSSSRHVYDDSLVLGIYIHRSDKLKIDIMSSYPVVKIHVFDQSTGNYVRKENRSDAVSSFNEQDKNDYIHPLMTQAYDFRKLKSPVPEWDEQIIFNERFPYFLQDNEDNPKVILFFEILDSISDDHARTNFEIQVQEKVSQSVAWAFLKLVGANDVLNVDTKLRLQLYYPPPRARLMSSSTIYDWWLKQHRSKYPSTLYVTIKGLKLPDNVKASFHDSLAMHQQLGSSISHTDLENENVSKTSEATESNRKEPLRWTRLPGQACHIPNKRLLSLRAGHMGCFSVCFSNDGRTLAAACADRDGYPIYLYEIPSGQYMMALHGHLSVVYDLCWSKNDQNLLSASSDCTVRLWTPGHETSTACKVLPHPSFVYAVKFHPMANNLVVTGCYDSVIRVWNVKVKEINGQLLQEFTGHNSFINTLCFDSEGHQMYSGDSSGTIIVWNTQINRSSQRNPLQYWSIVKEIKEPDMKGIPVNYLQVHPNGRRLLIHAKDSTLRIMDLRILAVKKYIGATHFREKIHSTFTPCGTFVFSGSEDGMAYVWNAETGDKVAKYSDLSYAAPLRDVAYHPHEHMVAFCAFGQNQPILVYVYDYKVAQLDAEVAAGSNNSEIRTFDELSGSSDRFFNAAKTSMRMMKVKQRLDSVLSGSNNLLPAPSLLSPHSKLGLPRTQTNQMFTQPISTNSFGGFSPVGHTLSRTPSVKLQMSNTDAKVSSLKIEADSVLPVQETVVALYDYTAHRSDELTIQRSDIIHVLYKDNDNWWFGCLANGQQGYFPANYVATETQLEESQSSAETSALVHKEYYDIEETPKRLPGMSVVPNKSKDLKFMSQHDTDADSPVTHGRKLKTLHFDESNLIRSDSNLSAGIQPSTSTSSALNEWGLQARPEFSVKPKRKKKLKHINSAGKTNIAFEPDT
ncbi:jouberin [Bombina bombina]|uniref:jouberin n=1 Tax=Bombina bombina TaxID=8345 RepID=UPI00235ACC90|nr:jouberin [Bombina bombina]